MGRPSKSSRFSGVKRKRSTRQEKQAISNVLAINSAPGPSSDEADKENAPAAMPDNLQEANARGDHYQKELYNSRKRLKRSHALVNAQDKEIEDLQATMDTQGSEIEHLLEDGVSLTQCNTELNSELSSFRQTASKKIHTLAEKVRRIPTRLETAVKKTTSKVTKQVTEEVTKEAPTLSLKDGGVIPDDTRSLINDLVAIDGVKPSRVASIMKRIAKGLGINISGDISRRSAGRIVKEGGVASQMQFVEAVQTGKAVTISGDGTTHKNINLESHHATVIDEDNNKHQFFLGISMAINHTSETQLEGWGDLVEEMYEVFRAGRDSGLVTADDARDFWGKCTGAHSDHAEDQKKLFRISGNLKRRYDRQQRGEQAMLHLSIEELEDTLYTLTQDAIISAGGIEAWDVLSQAEQKEGNEQSYKAFVERLGQKEFDKLSEKEKRHIDLFLWAGCCMHKDMNAFKGGCFEMGSFWVEHGLPGPLKMFNRDNAAAADLGAGTDAAARAEDRTCGGAVKVSSLAGAIFRHKDRKRGQQDTLRYFWDAKLGYNIAFPDTSNTRFQSHAEACTVIVTYFDLIIEFFDHIKENKGSRTLNHMEANVLAGLKCRYTQAEMVVIVLYHLAISIPYMREIRGPLRSETNFLKLGPLHEKVKTHVRAIIANPGLLTNLDISHTTGSLDGKMWEKPDAIYGVLRMIPTLPNVPELMQAFCTGALNTWDRFTSEFDADGALASATAEDIERAWMEATNDLNEGSFGEIRQGSKGSPTISLPYHNALKMYKRNGTSYYLRKLSPAERRRIRAIVRADDGSGKNRAAKLKIIEHMVQVTAQNKAKAQIRKDRIERAKAAVANAVAILSVEEFDVAAKKAPRAPGYLTVAALDLQLDWHLANTINDSAAGIPKTKSGAKGRGNRDSRVDLVRIAIVQYLSAQKAVEDGAMNQMSPTEEEEKQHDDDEEGYDSELEFYSR